jgi:hypothetical protein
MITWYINYKTAETYKITNNANFEGGDRHYHYYLSEANRIFVIMSFKAFRTDIFYCFYL